MEDFFKKYIELQNLRHVFDDAGVNGEGFYFLDDSCIMTLLKNVSPDVLVSFICKYNHEKSLLIKIVDANCVEAMEVDNSLSELNASFEVNKTVSVIHLSSRGDCTNLENLSNIEMERASDKDVFNYPQNELFEILNSSLEGKIILGKYARHKVLDYIRLKELIVMIYIKQNTTNYKISHDTFEKLTTQLVELFPTEKRSLFYVGSYMSKETKQSISASGCLYNYYKFLRKQLRLAGLLEKEENSNEDNSDDLSINDKNVNGLDCLRNPDRNQFTKIAVLTEWENTFEERHKLLSQKQKKKVVCLEQYFLSFPCLQFPLGTILLEQDFDHIINDLVNKNLIAKRDNYSSLFNTSWPKIASKIIKYCLTSKKNEVKKFVQENKNIFDRGDQNELLALFLVPICIKAVKTIKVNDATININKIDSIRYFLLHVKDPADLEKEKLNLETWLEALLQPIYPYVVICGKIEDSYQTFLILNKQNYVFDSAVKAVECCLKCLMSLKAEPYITDYIWTFLEEITYEFTLKKCNSFITKFIVDLNKL